MDRAFSGFGSYPTDRTEKNGEDGIEHNHEENRLDDRIGGPSADFLAVALHQHGALLVRPPRQSGGGRVNFP